MMKADKQGSESVSPDTALNFVDQFIFGGFYGQFQDDLLLQYSF